MCLALFAALSAPAFAQAPSQAVDDALAAMGGRDKVLAVRSLVIEGYGKNPNIGQAMTPEAEPLLWMLPDYRRAIDFEHGRMETSFTRRPAFPAVFDNARATQRQDGGVELLHHPIAILRAAVQPGARVTNLRRAGAGRSVDVTTAAGDTVTLTLDALNRPASVSSAVAHPNLGDTTRSTTFEAYENLDGVRLPKRFVTTLDRWVEYDIGVMKNTLDADVSALATPAARPAAPAPPVTVTVTPLGKGVWFLTGGGIPNLVIEFADHVAIVEPGSEARFRAALAKARELVPGKPVTQLVVSHHHFDHTGGLRAAVAEGLTIVTHRVNEAWFREAVKRKHSIAPDALARSPKPLKLVTVDDTHTLGDSANEVVLFHLAGSTHGDGILVMYLPRERLFVEPDVWNPGAQIQPHLGSLADEIARRRLQIERVVPLHGQQVQPYSELEKAVAEWRTRRATTTTQTRAAACEALAGTRLAAAVIDSARFVAAGTFVSDRARSQEPFKTLPAFCRIAGTVTTSPSSSIKIEVWLPETWNGRYLSNGYSFYGGLMDQALLAAAVRDGYATATTDAGGGGVRDASFLLNAPEKLIDVGERAWHETTVRAKSLAQAYYGRPVEFSYFEGCGGEGRQGLAAAQRYPEDFDGIAVGGIANNSSSFAVQNMHVWQVAHRSADSNLTPAALEVLHRGALNACDAGDGVADGIIQNPPACRFDPAAVACSASRTADCLTPVQVETARQIYAPVTHARTGARVSGSLMPGSERGWGGGVIGQQPNGYAVDYFKHLVFADPAWDYRTRPMELGADVDRAAQVPATFNPTSPDLSAFVSRGGRLLMYGGWNDVAIPPTANTDYYEAVVARMGAARVSDAVRLFMVPGMGHCPGRAGASAVDFDPLTILRRWKEERQAPSEIVATRLANGKEVGTALVCTYPQAPAYRGAGSPTDAASFSCR